MVKNKQALTPEEKAKKKMKRKQNRRKFFKILLYIILLFALISSIVRAVGLKSNMNRVKSFDPVSKPTDVKFTHCGNGVWNIETNHDLKVLQLSDVHIGGGYSSFKKDSMALNAVATMVKEENPDFVVVTGDISFPVPFWAGTCNNKTAPKLFAELMETLNVYWTLCYGNHDTEAYSYFDRKDITDFYSQECYPHCLMEAGPESVDGYGNQVFNILTPDGNNIRSFIVLDSHAYTDGDYLGAQWKYDNIHDNQINWYENTVKELNKKNEEKGFGPVPTSVFFHIPMKEYSDAWNEYKDNGYKDTENVKYHYGKCGEGYILDPNSLHKDNKTLNRIETHTMAMVHHPIHDDQMFETMSKLGSTDSVFVGHDHLNNFSVNYKGIDLIYAMSIDYIAYQHISIHKLGSQRGCKVIDVGLDGKIKTHNENYYQEKYKPKYEKESVKMQELTQVEK